MVGKSYVALSIKVIMLVVIRKTNLLLALKIKSLTQ